MKIAILGAGALGCAIGATLTEAGHETWLMVRSPDRVDAMRNEGLRVDDAQGTRRIQVRCSIANPGHRLKPEMYARVTLLNDQGQKAVRVPNGALVTQGLYSYVFVETQARVFAKRKVELAVQDREYAYVKSGVARGERVVVGGALLLQSELASGS